MFIKVDLLKELLVECLLIEWQLQQITDEEIKEEDHGN